MAKVFPHTASMRIKSRSCSTPAHLNTPAARRGKRSFSSAGETRAAATLVFPAEVLAALPPSNIPDNLLLTTAKDVDIPLKVILPSDAESEDFVQLMVNEVLVGTPLPLTGLQGGDEATIELKAADRQLQDGTHKINYRISYTVGGGHNDGPSTQTFVIDLNAPGKPFLGELRIEQDILDNGLTPDKLKTDVQGNKYLETFVPGYSGIAAGDMLLPLINGQSNGLFTEVVDVNATEVMLPFSESLLAMEADGAVTLSYYIIDRAGNNSDKADARVINKLISGVISDLEAPLVPLADDGLIDYADSLTPAIATIPGHDGILATDAVILIIGNTELTPVPVPGAGEEGVNLMDIEIPPETLYSEWVAAGGGDDILASVQISYRVLRGELTAGTSPATSVDTNLFTPGGEPGPDPVHRLLKAPTVQADSGQIDMIPVEDSDKDATVIISWTNNATPEAPVFLENDVVVVYWETEPLTAYTVTAADVGAETQLNIILPADIIAKVGAGEIMARYEVSRTLTNPPGAVNISRSPDKKVVVASKANLPGGLTGLVRGDFTPLNAGGNIGPAEIRRGVSFILPVYINQAIGDEVTLTFARYAGGAHNQSGDTLLQGTEWRYTGRVGSATEEFSISIPQENLINPVDVTDPNNPSYRVGHTHLTYTVTNSTGSATSTERVIAIDPRGFGIATTQS